MVENLIFYFSGTGNSLDVAKHIGEQLGDTLLIPMNDTPLDIYQRGSLRTGFIYPVYYGGMPRIVKRFIEKVGISDNVYTFAVATGSKKPGCALWQVDRIFENRDCHLSYSGFVKTVDNNLYKRTSSRNRNEKVAKSYAMLADIIKNLQDLVTKQVNHINPWNIPYHQLRLSEAIRREEKFYVNSMCDRCGICYRLCPTKNIELVDGKPVFHRHCEACMACLQFCPQNAINYKRQTQKKERYHHPNVRLEELLRR